MNRMSMIIDRDERQVTGRTIAWLLLISPSSAVNSSLQKQSFSQRQSSRTSCMVTKTARNFFLPWTISNSLLNCGNGQAINGPTFWKRTVTFSDASEALNAPQILRWSSLRCCARKSIGGHGREARTRWEDPYHSSNARARARGSGAGLAGCWWSNCRAWKANTICDTHFLPRTRHQEPFVDTSAERTRDRGPISPKDDMSSGQASRIR